MSRDKARKTVSSTDPEEIAKRLDALWYDVDKTKQLLCCGDGATLDDIDEAGEKLSDIVKALSEQLYYLGSAREEQRKKEYK